MKQIKSETTCCTQVLRAKISAHLKPQAVVTHSTLPRSMPYHTRISPGHGLMSRNRWSIKTIGQSCRDPSRGPSGGANEAILETDAAVRRMSSEMIIIDYWSAGKMIIDWPGKWFDNSSECETNARPVQWTIGIRNWIFQGVGIRQYYPKAHCHSLHWTHIRLWFPLARTCWLGDSW